MVDDDDDDDDVGLSDCAIRVKDDERVAGKVGM